MTMHMFKKRLVLSLFLTVAALVLSGILFTPPLFASDAPAATAASQPEKGDIMWS